MRKRAKTTIKASEAAARRCVNGYRRVPERAVDVRVATTAARPPLVKLSWDETARAMARRPENWSAWDETLSDGLDQAP